MTLAPTVPQRRCHYGTTGGAVGTDPWVDDDTLAGLQEISGFQVYGHLGAGAGVVHTLAHAKYAPPSRVRRSRSAAGATMPMSREPRAVTSPAVFSDPRFGSWVTYRDRMIGAGQMTAAVHWVGLATPLERGPGIFVVADRFCDAEQVVDIGHAHDLRAHFADTTRIAGWHDRTYGQVVIYTIPNSAPLDAHSALAGTSVDPPTDRFTDRS